MAVVAVPRRGAAFSPDTRYDRTDRGGPRSAMATALVLALAALAGAVATGGVSSAPPAPPPAVEHTDGDGLVDCDELADADYDDCIALTTGNLLWRSGTRR
ncbi:hypothetical protein [Nocardia sp. BMG111209]|uniref:hypothetical protein n=1 Tax=Nocardia sp. BMG111209 TaxID=1160137 RepID=UPI000360C506|nr:hypothetical protein [Nocardia sp. BMG111209]